MAAFNYDVPGEFYSRKTRGLRSTSLSYHRFDTTAEAIRFAIEDLSSAELGGSTLIVDGERFGAKELRQLYASSLYPLQRKERGADRTVQSHRRAKNSGRINLTD